IVVNLDFAAAVAPVEIFPGAKRRRALQFLLGEIEMIGAKRTIVSQARPGDRDVLLSHAEEAAKAEHRVSNVSAEFIDHEALYGADLAAIGTADRGAFDPVAGNQGMDWRVDVSVCMGASIVVPRLLALWANRARGLSRTNALEAYAVPVVRTAAAPRPPETARGKPRRPQTESETPPPACLRARPVGRAPRPGRAQRSGARSLRAQGSTDRGR